MSMHIYYSLNFWAPDIALKRRPPNPDLCPNLMSFYLMCGYTIDPLQIVIDTPDSPYILKNDGYNLTFRLYHPDDNAGFTEYSEASFSFYIASKAIPVIE